MRRLNSGRNRLQLTLTLMIPALLMGTGCQQLGQVLGTLAGNGTGTFTPATVPGAPTPAPGTTATNTGAAANPTTVGANGVPNVMNGQPQQPAAPGAILPPPAAGQAQATAIGQKYGVTVNGSCAEGQALQQLEAGIEVYAEKTKFKGITFDLPCDENEAGSAWWEPNATGALITVYVSKSGQFPVDRHVVVHELGHHTTLQAASPAAAAAGQMDERTAVGKQIEALFQPGPEWNPSQYGQTDPAEQLAELVAYCKQEPAGGSDVPPDVQGWKCPQNLVPITNPL